MLANDLETVEVYLGSHHRPEPGLFGPLPARRLGQVLVYEMQAPEQFEPWPRRSRIERKYALLDLGVSFGNPCWSRWQRSDGTAITIPPEQKDSWYVDLVTIDRDAGAYVVRDLYVDVMVGDGLLPRMLDLDELVDACEAGTITLKQLADGLRRWQRFLDRHLHASRFPQTGLTDFPPAVIEPLAAIEGLLGPAVTWPDSSPSCGTRKPTVVAAAASGRSDDKVACTLKA